MLTPINSAKIQLTIVKIIHRVEFNPFCFASAPILFDSRKSIFIARFIFYDKKAGSATIKTWWCNYQHISFFKMNGKSIGAEGGEE